MTELKTLKDIKAIDIIEEGKNTLFNNIFGRQIKDRHISEFVLKAEAIKWVKDINSKMPKELNIESHIVTWIKHFFNITEEDLK